MDKKTFYITTPIYYPSGKFHIGTAYTTTLADTIKRYKKMRGYDAYLLTGLDEHGQKVQTVAENRGLTPKAHVDEMAKEAKKLWSLMEIDYDQFIRTTDEKHEEVVSKVVEKFVANGDFSKFTGVKLDGTLVAADKYTAVSGSTVITLKKDYLSTLSVGKHTLTIVYNDGECSTEFEIKAAQSGGNTTPDKPNPEDPKSPQTGDNSNLTLWIALLFISGGTVIGTTVVSKKKKHAVK